MRVFNVHERQIRAPPVAVGALLVHLGQRDDALWPIDRWLPMRLDRPVAIGARGGHGPVRYVVSAYKAPRRVRFQFLAPRGFCGYHEFEIVPGRDAGTCLRHIVNMDIRGPALLSWPLLYRPLHDALIEDALTRAERTVDKDAPAVPWSPYVRALAVIVRAIHFVRRGLSR